MTMFFCVGERKRQPQIPPLRCGMTTKEQATAQTRTTADPLSGMTKEEQVQQQ
jgi:uncharacterized protein YcbX